MIEKRHVTKAHGNVFVDLGFSPEDAGNLLIRSQLMAEAERVFLKSGLTQAEGAKLFGIAQPRLNLLLKGRINEFSIDSLVNILARAGRRVEVKVRPLRKAA